jgi:hypothetical protein
VGLATSSNHEKLAGTLKTKATFVICAVRAFLAKAALAGAAMLMTAKAPAQYMYVAAAISGDVYTYTVGGTRSTFASGMSSPSGLALNNKGDLFVSDETGDAIYEFTTNGTKKTFASGLYYPDGLAFDSLGNLFEADYGSGKIYEFAPDGSRSTFATSGALGLAFNSAGHLFDATIDGTIYEYTPNGNRTTFASNLGGLFGLAFNSAGNLFTLDIGSGNVYEITPAGAVTTFATGFSNARGLTIDSADNIFVANYGSSNIVKITPAGVPTTFASGIETPTAILFPPGPPALSIALTATNTILISWPSPSTGFALEQSPMLGGTNWVLSTNAVAVVNATNQVLITPADNSLFFQLLKP